VAPKLGMQPIRQAQIIEATLRCIAETGLRNVTIQAVADRAGVSKGIVNHYFENKRDLLLKSFSTLLESVGQLAMASYDQRMSPLEMLDLITDAVFAPASLIERADRASLPHLSLTPGEAANIVIQFYARCLFDAEFHALLRKQYQGYETEIVRVIEWGMQTGQFKMDISPVRVAHGYMALYDGLLLYHALGVDFTTMEESRELCREYLRKMLCEDREVRVYE